MKEIHHLHKRGLGLILAGDVAEPGLDVIFRIDFGSALASYRHEISQSSFAASAVEETSHRRNIDEIEDQAREDEPEQEIEEAGILLLDFLHELDLAVLVRASSLQKSVYKAGIVNPSRPVGHLRLSGSEENLVLIDNHLLDRILLYLVDEGAIVDILDAGFVEIWRYESVNQEREDEAPEYRRPRVRVPWSLATFALLLSSTCPARVLSLVFRFREFYYFHNSKILLLPL